MFPLAATYLASSCYISSVLVLHVSSYCYISSVRILQYMCRDAAICVSAGINVFPLTATYLASSCYISSVIILHVSSYCYISSASEYCCICVVMLLHVCPQASTPRSRCTRTRRARQPTLRSAGPLPLARPSFSRYSALIYFIHCSHYLLYYRGAHACYM